MHDDSHRDVSTVACETVGSRRVVPLKELFKSNIGALFERNNREGCVRSSTFGL